MKYKFINLADIKASISPTVLMEFIYSAETLRAMEVTGSVRAGLNSSSMLYYFVVNLLFVPTCPFKWRVQEETQFVRSSTFFLF